MTKDLQVRMRAFEWLAEGVEKHGDVFDWKLLLRGFVHEGVRVPLVSMQGIFKPAMCELPLSIRTSVESPYHDRIVEDRIVYSYRGTDLNHRDNAGLRRLMRERIPLVYLHAVVEGRYLAAFPVFVVHDEPEQLRFWVQVEAQFGGALLTGTSGGAGIADESARRQYATRLVQIRLHQRSFRERVLGAQIRTFGNVAVAAAACEITENDAKVTRGVEMILLVKDAGAWRIVAQAWDTAKNGASIPDDLLSRRTTD